MSYALSIGLRYLRSRKRTSVSVVTVIAVTGVALGVAALLTVMSITGGFQDAFREKILGVNAHVLVLKYGLDFTEYPTVVELAEQQTEVAGAAPFLIHEMMLAQGDRLAGVLVKGVDPDRLADVLDLPEQMVAGTLDGLRLPGARAPTRPISSTRQADDQDLDAFLRDLQKNGVPEAQDSPSKDRPSDEKSPGSQRPEPSLTEGFGRVPDPEAIESALAGLDADDLGLPGDDLEAALFDAEPSADELAQGAGPLPGVIVGKTLAENLELKVGSAVRIISPLASLDTSLWTSGNARAPRSRDFVVKGIFEAGFQEYDSRLVYIDLHESQRFFDRGDSVVGVELKLHDIEQASAIATRLHDSLGGTPFHTMDWKELNQHLFRALEIQKMMLSLVIATIIFVAAFNVIATLIMIVLEKKREISILKAMGSTDRSVLVIFMVQGVVIGILGTLAGLVLGGLVTGYLQIYNFPLDPKVYLIDHLPVRTSISEFAWTVLIALGICFSATLLPSYWAARQLPAVGVRQD